MHPTQEARCFGVHGHASDFVFAALVYRNVPDTRGGSFNPVQSADNDMSRYSQILRMFLPPPCTGLKKQPMSEFGRGQLAEPQGRSKNSWYTSKVHKMYEYALSMQTRNFLNVLGARPARPPRAGVWAAFLILYTGIGGWRQKRPDAVRMQGADFLCGIFLAGLELA